MNNFKLEQLILRNYEKKYRKFTPEEKLQILNEADQHGIEATL